MPNSRVGKGGRQQGNILPWIVLLIWVLALLSGGMLVMAAAAGWVDGEAVSISLSGDGLSQESVDFRSEQNEPLESGSLQNQIQESAPSGLSAENQNPGKLGEGNSSSGGIFVEPTWTPQIPLTPTPTAFITPIPFWEGPIVIGTSIGGRPLEVYRFGNGPVKRMIAAGIHGGYEWNTVALVNQLITHFQTHPEFIPRTVSLYILRVINPDGLARGRGVVGHDNENSVDLNRNFPINWQKDWPRTGCWNFRKNNGGAEPGSESETQAVMNFILDLRPTALISYHSAALGIFPGGIPPHEPSVKLAQTIADESTYRYPPIDTGCLYTGTLADFAAFHGIAAVDLELHTHEGTDFEENLEVLRAFLNWRND